MTTRKSAGKPARRAGRALAYGAAVVAVIASTAFSCTVGSGSDDTGGDTHASSGGQGGSAGGGSAGGSTTGGGTAGGGKGQPTGSHPSHSTSTTSSPPEWKPSGPASVTTCGTAPNGYRCVVHASGFKPGEIVDWTVVYSNAKNTAQADEHGDVSFNDVVSSAPGVTVTVRLHGEESGQEATGSWTLTCSDANGDRCPS